MTTSSTTSTGDPLGHATRLQTILDHASTNHASLAAAHDALTPQQRKRMLTIAGVGEKTVFRLEYQKEFFGLWEHAKKVTKQIDDDPHRVGDGRVPVASATLPGVAMRYVKGVHGNLTNIPAVIHDTIAFVRGEALSLPSNLADGLAKHLAPVTSRWHQHSTDRPSTRPRRQVALRRRTSGTTCRHHRSGSTRSSECSTPTRCPSSERFGCSDRGRRSAIQRSKFSK